MNKILLLTPDYPSKNIGGLSTFAVNIEKILQHTNRDYDLKIWDDPREVKTINLDQYDLVLNIQFFPAYFVRDKKIVNFIHGSELFPYSPNLLKYCYKKMFFFKWIRSLERAHFNIFISESTQNVFKEVGGRIDYKRDIVFHNCIDTEGSELILKDWNQSLNFCCFARNVPHKNLEGTVAVFKTLRDKHPHGAKLYLTCGDFSDDKDIINIQGVSDKKREEILRDSHLNLLLSLDHRKKGQIEGFGLTVLEAGKYGVPTIGSTFGGLAESVQHLKNGWSLDLGSSENLEDCYTYISKNFKELQRSTFIHTQNNCSLSNYQRLLEKVL